MLILWKMYPQSQFEMLELRPLIRTTEVGSYGSGNHRFGGFSHSESSCPNTTRATQQLPAGVWTQQGVLGTTFFLQKNFQACSVRGHFQLYWANVGGLFEYCEWSFFCKLMEGATEFNLYNKLYNLEVNIHDPSDGHDASSP